MFLPRHLLTQVWPDTFCVPGAGPGVGVPVFNQLKASFATSLTRYFLCPGTRPGVGVSVSDPVPHDPGVGGQVPHRRHQGPHLCPGKNSSSYVVWVHCKKTLRFSRPRLGCHLPNSPWAGKLKLFPARESLVSDIPTENEKSLIFFTVYGIYRISSIFPLHILTRFKRFSTVVTTVS